MPQNIPLKVAIVQSGKTQNAIAEEIGMSVFRLSRIVNGHDYPRPEERTALAKAVRRRVSEVFAGVAA